MTRERKGAVVFDFNRTLFDPTVYALYNGVIPMLEELKRTRRLMLFSKKGWDRHLLLDTLGISAYFDSTHFVEQKSSKVLQGILASHGLNAADCIIVGDMLSEEICAGQELGMRTVWFRQSRFRFMSSPDVSCVPHHTVHSIAELRELLRTL